MSRLLPKARHLPLIVFPLLSYLYLLSFWLLGSLSRGYWLRPSLDDPKDFAGGIPATLGVMLIVLSIALLPVLMLVGRHERRTITYLLCYGACLILMLGLLRADVLSLTSWILD